MPKKAGGKRGRQKGFIPWNKGNPLSDAVKKKMREGHQVWTKGKKHWNWKGGLSPEMALFETSPEWQAVRRQVWKRDKATCQLCHDVYVVNGKRFHVHHIIPFKSNAETNLDINNLILLCSPCHVLVTQDNFTDRFALAGIL